MCVGCKHENRSNYEEPCCSCVSIRSNFKPKQEIKKWKPKKGETYYVVMTIGNVFSVNSYSCVKDNSDYPYINSGNCFKTRKEAVAVANKVKKLFKGI